MKKLLLVSMFLKSFRLLKAVAPDLEGKTVTYIPTASTVEKLGFLVKIDRFLLRRLGINVDELDVSTAPAERIQTALEKNDCIFITGGNTFFLLNELRRTGADKMIAEQVARGKLYVGESAGAIVAAPHIGYSAAMDDVSRAPGLLEYTGLNLTDFYTVPHADNREFKKALKRIVGEYAENLDLKVLRDKQAVLVEGGEVRVLG